MVYCKCDGKVQLKSRIQEQVQWYSGIEQKSVMMALMMWMWKWSWQEGCFTTTGQEKSGLQIKLRLFEPWALTNLSSSDDECLAPVPATATEKLATLVLCIFTLRDGSRAKSQSSGLPVPD